MVDENISRTTTMVTEMMMGVDWASGPDKTVYVEIGESWVSASENAIGEEKYWQHIIDGSPVRGEIKLVGMKGKPIAGRNEKCPCGSGKKTKHCHRK